MPTLANVSIKDSSSWITLLNMIYPVGSYYISNNSTSPATRFGGTWSRLQDNRFLRCGTSPSSTGGAEFHKHILPFGYDENGTFYWWISNYKRPITGSMVQSNVRHYNTAWSNFQEINGNVRITFTDFPATDNVPENNTTDGGASRPSSNLPLYRDVAIWYRTA